MDLMMSVMMTRFPPRKTAKPFGELQISCPGQFGILHPAVAPTSTLTHEYRIVALIELAERAAYYGVSGPFQNYIQNTYKSPSGLPGALGLGQSTATRFTNFFAFFCYVTPVFGWCSLIKFCSNVSGKSID
jgi:hypothetical protein